MKRAPLLLLSLSLFTACASQDDSTGEANGGLASAGASGQASGGAGGQAAGGQATGGQATGGQTAGGGAGGEAQSGGGQGGGSNPWATGTCPSPAVDDGLSAKRASCAFKAGDHVADTIGLDEARRKAIPIKHIIVVMKENRSFDELFGELYRQGQPDAEPAPEGFSNLDAEGNVVPRYHETNMCFPADPGHQWEEMHAQVNGGKMDGFVTSGGKTSSRAAGRDGHFVMGYFDKGDLPFYYWLANTYSIADHYFPSILSGTWPNRDFMLFGTNDGVRFTGDGFPKVPSIFDSLDAAKVGWTAYSDGIPLEFCTGWFPGHEGTGKMADFYAALEAGTLPAVSFVDGKGEYEDEHPPADMQFGEAWTRKIYQAVRKSPVWSSTALLFTYDEAGGFADHVPPPLACAPTEKDAESTELGIRVPLIVISPYARRHHVSHVQHEHTSITRFIEAVFDLPALTARDANVDALLDMFDFGCPSDDPGEPPEAGSGGCMKGGSGGATGAGGSGGAGGASGGPGAKCADEATAAACATCCDETFPLAKVKHDLALITKCGCEAGVLCADACTSSCPSGPADAGCAACLSGAEQGDAECAESARSDCEIDSDCAPLVACKAACIPLP